MTQLHPDRSHHVSAFNIIWPVVLSLGVMGIIAWYTYDEGAIREMIRAVNPWIMAAAVLSVVVRVLTGGWRLSFISRHRLSFRQGLRAQLAWDFASNVTPSVVGGAPVAAYYIARESEVDDNGKTPISMGEVTAMMTFTMLLDQVWFALTVPLVLVSAIFLEVIPSEAGRFGLWTITAYFIVFMCYTGIFAYGTLFRPAILGRIADAVCRLPLLRRYRERVAREMETFEERASVLRHQPGDFFLRGLLLSSFTWISRYVLVVLIFWSFVPDIDKWLLFLRSVAMTMSSLIMPTPGGAGGIEGLYALFYGSMLPDTALLAPSLLVWRFLGYYIFLILGIGLSTRHIQRRVLNKSV
jgi:uncharacterized protein (TIRG00374 family)